MSESEVKTAEPLVEPLTRREREVLALLAQGLSGPEIAQHLTLALSSVKSHIQRLYGKLGVNRRHQALLRARALGLLVSSAAAAPLARPVAQPPVVRHNLPMALTRFFGRESETSTVRELLAEYRQVTVTGAGGVGKTRLALRVAEDLLDAFHDGVWLIELAALSDPALVAQTVAVTLSVREEAGRPIVEPLIRFLRGRQVLLLLDNCEHLLDACAQLADQLLRACPRLTILATSREPLNSAGEAVFLAPSLPFPDPGQALSVEQVGAYAAVNLFADRARMVHPSYRLTPGNAGWLARICQRLDGLPLAIEMAAARMNLLTARQLANRLDDAFTVLAAGRRTALPRQQTLRATLDWSYALLAEPERLLLQRLSVFAGGCSLEAAEAVCADEGLPAGSVLEALASLVSKSMVIADRRQGQDTRFRLLEMVRQYALAQLDGSGQTDSQRRRHAGYYLTLVEAGTAILAPETETPQPAWFDQIGAEYDNVRAALTWTQLASGSAAMAQRLALRLGIFWWRRGYFSEARLWTAGTLGLTGADDQPLAQAELFRKLGLFEAQLGDYRASQAHFESSLTLFRAQHDLPRTAYALRMLGWVARERGDAANARPRLEESVRMFREIGDKELLADGLVTLGEVLVMLDDAAGAAPLIEEGLALWRELRDPDGVAWALNHLGHAAQIGGEYERARRLHEQSLAAFRALDSQYYGLAWAHQGLGETALAQSNGPLATAHFTEALTLSRDAGYRASLVWCLAGLAGVAALAEAPEPAARLWGAAEALRQSIGSRPAPAAQATHARLMAAARAQLGAEAFATAWDQGRAMDLEQAIELALGNVADRRAD